MKENKDNGYMNTLSLLHHQAPGLWEKVAHHTGVRIPVEETLRKVGKAADLSWIKIWMEQEPREWIAIWNVLQEKEIRKQWNDRGLEGTRVWDSIVYEVCLHQYHAYGGEGIAAQGAIHPYLNRIEALKKGWAALKETESSEEPGQLEGQGGGVNDKIIFQEEKRNDRLLGGVWGKWEELVQKKIVEYLNVKNNQEIWLEEALKSWQGFSVSDKVRKNMREQWKEKYSAVLSKVWTYQPEEFKVWVNQWVWEMQRHPRMQASDWKEWQGMLETDIGVPQETIKEWKKQWMWMLWRRQDQKIQGHSMWESLPDRRVTKSWNPKVLESPEIEDQTPGLRRMSLANGTMQDIIWIDRPLERWKEWGEEVTEVQPIHETVQKKKLISMNQTLNVSDWNRTQEGGRKTDDLGWVQAWINDPQEEVWNWSWERRGWKWVQEERMEYVLLGQEQYELALNNLEIRLKEYEELNPKESSREQQQVEKGLRGTGEYLLKSYLKKTKECVQWMNWMKETLTPEDRQSEAWKARWKDEDAFEEERLHWIQEHDKAIGAKKKWEIEKEKERKQKKEERAEGGEQVLAWKELSPVQRLEKWVNHWKLQHEKMEGLRGIQTWCVDKGLLIIVEKSGGVEDWTWKRVEESPWADFLTTMILGYGSNQGKTTWLKHLWSLENAQAEQEAQGVRESGVASIAVRYQKTRDKIKNPDTIGARQRGFEWREEPAGFKSSIFRDAEGSQGQSQTTVNAIKSKGRWVRPNGKDIVQNVEQEWYQRIRWLSTKIDLTPWIEEQLKPGSAFPPRHQEVLLKLRSDIEKKHYHESIQEAIQEEAGQDSLNGSGGPRRANRL